MNDWSVVTGVIDEHRTRYEKLLAEVRAACEVVRAKRSRFVADVYSRGALQDGNEFKRAHKIAAKLRGRDLAVAEDTVLELGDVIGVTVVVRYPDEIDHVVDLIRAELKSRRIRTGKPEKKTIKERGYFATHLICTRYDIFRFKCEIQIKSPLHDAWARKTHDLTYKPAGVLDPRLEALMASIAQTLQTLEEQSILVRDMIQARWDVDQEARRSVRQAMSKAVHAGGDELRKSLATTVSASLLAELARLETALESPHVATLPANVKDLVEIMEAIDSCCAEFPGLRLGWLLAGRLAMTRPEGELSGFLRKHVKRFMRLVDQPGNAAEGFSPLVRCADILCLATRGESALTLQTG